jgi:hypothetical protein
LAVQIDHMKRIAPTDIPEDLIAALAQAGKREAFEAADFAAWLLNRMQDVIADFDLEWGLDQLRDGIAHGRFDDHAPTRGKR